LGTLYSETTRGKSLPKNSVNVLPIEIKKNHQWIINKDYLKNNQDFVCNHAEDLNQEFPYFE